MVRIGGVVVLGGLVLGGGALLTLSCAQVLDANDYHVGSGGGGSSSGGSSCNASGIDQSKLKTVVNACVWLESCNPFASLTMSDCITLNIPEAFDFEKCALTAGSCSDIEQCLGVGYSTTDDCKTAGTFCNGSRAATCRGAGIGATRRCDILGGACATYTLDSGTQAGCEVVPLCGNNDNQEHCSDAGVLYECIGDAGFGAMCTSGLTCGTQNNQTACYANLPSCSLSGSQCQGDTYVLCTSSGTQIQYNCGDVGLQCQSANGTTSCVAPGCTPNDVTMGCTESCTGTIANLCVGGAPVSVDCASFGFVRCSQFPAQNSFKAPFVMCVPY
jgi:hypothetical protein